MSSTLRSTTTPVLLNTTSESIRWRSWPLVDQARWSWTIVTALPLVGAFTLWMGGSWFLAAVLVAAVTTLLWQFLFPVTFELTPLGLRRHALRRVRLIPWQAIRAFQLRPTGVLFFQHPTPTRPDILRAFFLPYPPDADELLLALRTHLPHATELPQ